jgi:hypothetical protein
MSLRAAALVLWRRSNLLIQLKQPLKQGIAYHFVPMLGIMAHVVGKSKSPPRTASPLGNDICTVENIEIVSLSVYDKHNQKHLGVHPNVLSLFLKCLL